jgi:hypothetical protein
MAQLTGYVGARLAQLAPQDTSNLLWACAKLDFTPRELLDNLPSVVVDRLPSFKPQVRGAAACWRMLAVTAGARGAQCALRLACAWLQCTRHSTAPTSCLLPPGHRACAARRCCAQEVCNLLYGYGHLHHRHPPLLEAAARVLHAGPVHHGVGVRRAGLLPL